MYNVVYFGWSMSMKDFLLDKITGEACGENLFKLDYHIISFVNYRLIEAVTDSFFSYFICLKELRFVFS